MTPPTPRVPSVGRHASRTPHTVAAPADGHHSAVRVKASAGPVKGELEVTSSGPPESPASTAVTILVLVTAAALAAVTTSLVGWLAALPALVTGAAAYGALAATLGTGLYLAYRRGRPDAPYITRRGNNRNGMNK